MAELRILEGESSEIKSPTLKEPRYQFLLALIGLGLFFTLELLQMLLMPWQPKEV